MPKFMIERELAGAGLLSPDELQAISQESCQVLADLGTNVQWQHSCVTADKVYWVYLAASEDLVREHARRGGFPANAINRVSATIDPTTAEIPSLLGEQSEPASVSERLRQTGEAVFTSPLAKEHASTSGSSVN